MFRDKCKITVNWFEKIKAALKITLEGKKGLTQTFRLLL